MSWFFQDKKLWIDYWWFGYAILGKSVTAGYKVDSKNFRQQFGSSPMRQNITIIVFQPTKANAETY